MKRMDRRSMLVAGAGGALWPLSGRAQATPDGVLAEEEATRLLRRYVEDVLVARDRDAFLAVVARDIPAQLPDDADGSDALWQRLLDGWREEDDRGKRTLAVAELIASGSKAMARVEMAWDEEYSDEDDATGDWLLFVHIEGARIARLWSAWLWHRTE